VTCRTLPPGSLGRTSSGPWTPSLAQSESTFTCGQAVSGAHPVGHGHHRWLKVSRLSLAASPHMGEGLALKILAVCRGKILRWRGRSRMRTAQFFVDEFNSNEAAVRTRWKRSPIASLLRSCNHSLPCCGQKVLSCCDPVIKAFSADQAPPGTCEPGMASTRAAETTSACSCWPLTLGRRRDCKWDPSETLCKFFPRSCLRTALEQQFR
jgi:hypothetical protein